MPCLQRYILGRDLFFKLKFNSSQSEVFLKVENKRYNKRLKINLMILLHERSCTKSDHRINVILDDGLLRDLFSSYLQLRQARSHQRSVNRLCCDFRSDRAKASTWSAIANHSQVFRFEI